MSLRPQRELSLSAVNLDGGFTVFCFDWHQNHIACDVEAAFGCHPPAAVIRAFIPVMSTAKHKIKLIWHGWVGLCPELYTVKSQSYFIKSGTSTRYVPDPRYSSLTNMDNIQNWVSQSLAWWLRTTSPPSDRRRPQLDHIHPVQTNDDPTCPQPVGQ